MIGWMLAWKSGWIRYDGSLAREEQRKKIKMRRGKMPLGNG